MTYEKRIVAFVDILGFKNAIKSTIKDGVPDLKRIKEIDLALFEMARLMEIEPIEISSILFGKETPPSAIATQFSDSLVASLHSDDPAEVFRWLLKSLYWVPIQLMSMAGLTCRGGVTFGYALHNESRLFGPAINSAYHLSEDKDKAIYPRIVIDPKVISMLDGGRGRIREKEGLEIEDLLTRDKDGWYYIDYFKRIPNEGGAAEWDEYTQRLNNVVSKHLQCTDSRLLKKYQWMRAKMT